jgi:hypothetical protein
MAGELADLLDPGQPAVLDLIAAGQAGPRVCARPPATLGSRRCRSGSAQPVYGALRGACGAERAGPHLVRVTVEALVDPGVLLAL